MRTTDLSVEETQHSEVAAGAKKCTRPHLLMTHFLVLFSPYRGGTASTSVLGRGAAAGDKGRDAAAGPVGGVVGEWVRLVAAGRILQGCRTIDKIEHMI